MRRGLFISLAVIVLALGTLLMLKQSKPTPATTAPTTRRVAATKPAPPRLPIAKKVVDMPVLQSPNEYGPASDPRIGGLIAAHNATQDKIKSVALAGGCTWALDGSPGNPRKMTVAFDRPTAKATIACGPQQCTAEGASVTMPADSALHIDALYLVMFRKYDPEDFKLVPGGGDEGTSVVAASAKEKLTFDGESGKLVAVELPSEFGPVIVKFTGTVEIAGSDATVPATVSITPPKKMFMFDVKQGGTVTFAIKEGKVQ